MNVTTVRQDEYSINIDRIILQLKWKIIPFRNPWVNNVANKLEQLAFNVQSKARMEVNNG
jgi:hypothetical protein